MDEEVTEMEVDDVNQHRGDEEMEMNQDKVISNFISEQRRKSEEPRRHYVEDEQRPVDFEGSRRQEGKER